MSFSVIVIECDAPPSSAPNITGQRWIDTTSGCTWYAVGTASVNDWVLVPKELTHLLDVDVDSPADCDVLKYNSSTGKWENVPEVDLDDKVKTSSNDTTPGFLRDKLTTSEESNSTDILELKEVNDGFDENLKIAIDPSKIDHDNLQNYVAGEHTDAQVKVSANDTTPGYLEDKIIASVGTNATNALEATTLNEAADEDVQIQLDESKINHNNLAGFVADEHHASGSDNQNLFETINTPMGTNPVADSQNDTLNLTSSDNSVTITGDSATDSVDFKIDTTVTDQDLFKTITGDTGTATADSTTDSIKMEGGTNITTTASDTPDKVVFDWAANLDDLTDVDAPTPSNNDVLTYNTTTNKWEPSSNINTDEFVKVSANDTTSGFLNGKLVAGTGINLTEQNDGGNETLKISAPGSTTDEKVSVSSNDTTPGYLQDKLIATEETNVTSVIELKEVNDGANENLKIAFDESKIQITESQISDLTHYTHPNHTGDVTSIGDGAQTITNNAVTNVKAADMPANTIKGNNTGATADPSDLTVAQAQTLLNIEDGANNYIHPNHTGEVTSTGDGAQVVDKTAISNKTLVTAAADDHVLVGDASDTDNLKKVTVQSIVDLASATNVSDSQTLDVGGNNLFKSYGANENNIVTKEFIYLGTTKTLSKAYALVDPFEISSITIEVYDLTNAISICSATASTAGKSILDLGTISNLPSTDAIFQIRVTTGTGNNNASAKFWNILLEFN